MPPRITPPLDARNQVRVDAAAPETRRSRR
jgi:hypothetical protein